MKTIWKYEAPVTDSVMVAMPEGATILSVERTYPRTFAVWAEVDSDAPLQARELISVGTGAALPETGRFIGTVQDFQSVWHIYEGAR